MGSVTDLHTKQRRAVIWAGAALLSLALLLYLYTLDNGFAPGELVGGDLITHQYAQVQARPSNAPGYPLYTMGGWLWFHALRSVLQAVGNSLPNPITLLSAYSTFWAILALGLLYALLVRLTRSGAWPNGNWPLAWLISAFYAVTYFFWYYATTTEQYTSAIAQTLAIVYVYLLWCEAAKFSRAQNRLLILLAFLCGLSLAHMLTVAFIVPPLVAVVLWQQPRLLRNWRLVVLCVVAAFLPLAAYWYVWLRGAAHPEWWGQGEWRTAGEWFWAFVSTAQGRDELSWGLRSSCALFANGFPALIWQELSLPIVLMGVGGIALLRRPLAVVLYATLVIYLVFNWLYRCANWYQVILPAYPLLLLGVAAAADAWQHHFRSYSWRWLHHLPAMLLAAAILWRAALSWVPADSAHRPGDTALDRATVLLSQPLPPAANLFAPVADALALDYLIRIWGVRPDLAVVSSSQAGDRLRAGEPVFATYDVAPVLLAELPADLPLQRAGAGPDWLELALATDAVALPAVDGRHEVIAGVTLLGYAVQPAPSGASVSSQPAAADVTLYWKLDTGWPENLGISLRPTTGGNFLPDPAGAPGAIIQVDAPAPVHGLAAAGPAPLADAYRVPMPADADGILLIIYTREGDDFRNLLELPLAAEQPLE